ncbi:hypothetical protein ETW24_10550 [Leisingera sp. NJS204]|nr:hypothetical protein ETW24_10550 [Leisingera sp. NJS204]
MTFLHGVVQGRRYNPGLHFEKGDFAKDAHHLNYLRFMGIRLCRARLRGLGLLCRRMCAARVCGSPLRTYRTHASPCPLTFPMKTRIGCIAAGRNKDGPGLLRRWPPFFLLCGQKTHEADKFMTDHPTDQDGAAVLTRQVHYTADLLRSLQESIHRLRNEAEELREQLDAEGADEVTGAKSQVSKLEQLIRDCQKVERLLAEQSTEFARMLKSEHELDLVAARAAVERGLSGLRSALAPELVLE